MNASNAQAAIVVDELVRGGTRQVVLCPGWRSAPLAIALQRAADAGRIDLHVRIDERSAGFLALGLAQVSDGPVALVCTSGTAVANLHPAVLEADHSGVGFLLLTADRPPELHNTGASQTMEQRGVFGRAADLIDLPVADDIARQNATWRGLLCRALARSQSGPVQVNIPLRDPLGPGAEEPPMPGRPDGRPWTTIPSTQPAPTGGQVDFRLPARTLMIVGSGDALRARAAAGLAAKAAWPVVAEPMAVAPTRQDGASVLRCGALLLATGELPTGLLELPPALRPEAIVLVGRPTLSAELKETAVPVYCVDDYPEWTDPAHVATHVRGWLDVDDLEQVDDPDPEWLVSWQEAAKTVAKALDDVLDAEPQPSGLRYARDLVAAMPSGSALFIGPSNPVRDVYFAAEPRDDIEVFANRGVAGIDGNVSTAAGIALGREGRTYALMGDLSFLYDTNGLWIGPGDRRPDLTIVVLNDQGGGNFALLDQGDTDATGFERVFGTPQDADLGALCAGHGVPHLLVADADGLYDAVKSSPPGLNVIEVRAKRPNLRPQHLRLREAITEAVAETFA